jgi:3-hydroxyisobutyrate dehydrogenase-like beta-hydroxyacid dehydrogenase
MRAGFVGAGRMGRPMVDRLVAAGLELGASLGVLDDAIAALEAITRG